MDILGVLILLAFLPILIISRVFFEGLFTLLGILFNIIDLIFITPLTNIVIFYKNKKRPFIKEYIVEDLDIQFTSKTIIELAELKGFDSKLEHNIYRNNHKRNYAVRELHPKIPYKSFTWECYSL